MPERHQLQQIIDDPASTMEERSIAQARLDALDPDQTIGGEPSAEAMALLRSLNKSHLIDVTAGEWSKYSQHRGITEDICEEYWQWHCPDDEYLRLLGVSRRWHWQRVRDRATSNDVRAHAITQIKDSDGH